MPPAPHGWPMPGPAASAGGGLAGAAWVGAGAAAAGAGGCEAGGDVVDDDEHAAASRSASRMRMPLWYHA